MDKSTLPRLICPILGPGLGLGVVSSVGVANGEITELAVTYGCPFGYALWVGTEVCRGKLTDGGADAVYSDMRWMLSRAGAGGAPQPSQTEHTSIRVLGQDAPAIALRWGSYQTARCHVAVGERSFVVSLRAHHLPVERIALVERSLNGLVLSSGKPAAELLTYAVADPDMSGIRFETTRIPAS